MLNVTFYHDLNGTRVKVIATATDVNSYEAEALKIEIFDDDDNQIDLSNESDEFSMLEEIADELMYEKKYQSELEF